jgi:hypothetical protein
MIPLIPFFHPNGILSDFEFFKQSFFYNAVALGDLEGKGFLPCVAFTHKGL